MAWRATPLYACPLGVAEQTLAAELPPRAPSSASDVIERHWHLSWTRLGMHGVQVGLMPWWDDPEASLADATCSQFPGAASRLFWSGMHTVGPNGLRMGSGNPVAANAESLSDSTTKSFCHDIPNPCPVNLNPRSTSTPGLHRTLPTFVSPPRPVPFPLASLCARSESRCPRPQHLAPVLPVSAFKRLSSAWAV